MISLAIALLSSISGGSGVSASSTTGSISCVEGYREQLEERTTKMQLRKIRIE